MHGGEGVVASGIPFRQFTAYLGTAALAALLVATLPPFRKESHAT